MTEEATNSRAVVSFGRPLDHEGHHETVALALNQNRHMPIDAMGFPVGLSTRRAAEAIPIPRGITTEEWLTAIEVAVEHFRLTSGVIPPNRENLSGLSSMKQSVWAEIYDNGANQRSFEATLALKGILKKGSGLTYDQLRCLRYLTDVTVRGTLESRLSHLKISWERFQNWQRDPRFSSQFKQISEEILEQAQPLVMTELTRMSVRGNLEAIKYFHQVTGRYDGAISAADLQSFLNGLIEILQLEIQDETTLRSIGMKLAKLRRETLGGSSNG